MQLRPMEKEEETNYEEENECKYDKENTIETVRRSERVKKPTNRLNL